MSRRKSTPSSAERKAATGILVSEPPTSITEPAEDRLERPTQSPGLPGADKGRIGLLRGGHGARRAFDRPDERMSASGPAATSPTLAARRLRGRPSTISECWGSGKGTRTGTTGVCSAESLFARGPVAPVLGVVRAWSRCRIWSAARDPDPAQPVRNEGGEGRPPASVPGELVAKHPIESVEVSFDPGRPWNMLAIQGQEVRFTGQRRRAAEIIDAVSIAQASATASSAIRP